MDLLKQLESKMQALVQQRNLLREELEALKAAGAVGDRELQSLRARLEEAVAEKVSLEQEREVVKEQVASILRALEALG
jgi:FtsZ-binding cell division protein ZapB